MLKSKTISYNFIITHLSSFLTFRISVLSFRYIFLEQFTKMQTNVNASRSEKVNLMAKVPEDGL